MFYAETQRFAAERMRAEGISRPVDHAPLASAPDAVSKLIQKGRRDKELRKRPVRCPILREDIQVPMPRSTTSSRTAPPRPLVHARDLAYAEPTLGRDAALLICASPQ